jgi:DNA-binding transcriptional MocR family regulator
MLAEFAEDFRDGIDINLGVGYVNEKTIPNNLIMEAQREVLSHPEKYRAALNYGGSKGSRNLIASIKRYHIDNRIGGLDETTLEDKEIIIGPNGATSILDGISHLLTPGIVITADPIYYIYCNLLERAGFEVLAIPEDNYGIRSFIYIVTVNNPTSTILSNQRRKELIEIITELSQDLKRKIPIFFDKAYEDLIHDSEVEKPISGLIHDELGLVYEIGSLSKVLAPALRIGYMVGPYGAFMDAMVQRTNDVGFSAPLITQEIASYMLDNHVREQIRRVNEGYRKRAIAVKKRISEKLDEDLLDCKGGSAGFYFYLTFKEGIDTDEASYLYRFLTRMTGEVRIDGPPDKHPRVIYLPGEFCVHPKGNMVEPGRRQMRISYGFEELERIEEALCYISEGVSIGSI